MKILGFSLTSYESGIALMEDKKIFLADPINTARNISYIGRLKNIFFQSRRMIWEYAPDFIAIKQEVLHGHPGTTMKNARILGLILAASWCSRNKPKVIEVSSAATNQVCGLHAFTKLTTVREKVSAAIQKMYPEVQITSYRQAEAVAVCIASKWRIELWEKQKIKSRNQP